jgi:hypothetical protein
MEPDLAAIGPQQPLKAVCRTAARKFLIDLSGSGIPLTCTKVFDQERRGY